MTTPRQRAMEKAALVEADKERQRQADAEKNLAKEWSVGAKDNNKSKSLEDKEMEKQRKAAEMAALLAAEDAELSGIKKVAKTKKKGKDDFDALNDALSKMPKTKAQKEAEAKKKADEERKKKEEEARAAKEARLKAEEEEVRKAAAKGMVMNHTDDLLRPINNRLSDADEINATGTDAAVDALADILGKGTNVSNVDKRMKSLYNAFYEAQLPQMKDDHPGLKLSQYQERIFLLWKTSPENPVNQVKGSVQSRDAWKIELAREQELEKEPMSPSTVFKAPSAR